MADAGGAPVRLHVLPHEVDRHGKDGDQVYYGKFGGNDVKVDGEDYLLLRADDIYAVIED